MSVTSVRTREARSYAANVAPLPQGRDAQLSLEQVWPYIDQYARQYGVDPKVLAGIIAQESSFKNWGVHHDGTGHGLIGLDDNGLLPDFERWSGMSIGRGASARTIPPEKQIEYLAKTIGEMTQRYGDSFAAARAWHRGPGGMNDSRGRHYEDLIRGHIGRLFPNGATPPSGPTPTPTTPGPTTPGPTTPTTPGPGAVGSDYTIRRGDTLWAIASRLKAQGVPGSEWDIIRQIQQMNPKITDPNLIIAGDTIKLPAPGGAAFSSDDMSTGVGTALRDQANTVTGNTPVAPVGDAPAGGNYDVPYISQYRPVGAENGYYNGPSNCGPTSMAMLARAFGYGAGMSDAQLINALGRAGGTTGDGTNVNGIIAMAREMGKEGQMRQGGGVDFMIQALQEGKLCVANGDYYAMPPHVNDARTSGHYVAVVGYENGNFIVRDPADQNVRLVSREQMEQFITSNPNGGFQFAIG